MRSHALLAKLLLSLVLCALCMGVAPTTQAEVAPAKPYAELVAEVVGFLVSDVGRNGIRTNDNDPDGYPVPPYFYSYAINDGNNLNGNLNGYPGYLSVSYPAYTACVGIDAFLDWRRFSGNPEGLVRARQYADWILEHRTPPSDIYGNLPYSTQTDGVMGGGWDGLAIMTDKPPMFGLRLLRLYDITGDISYLNGATEIADVMAATQMTGTIADDGRWPFRVVPADGTVTQDYTSHLIPAVRFFDDMANRTGSSVYAQTRDRAWAWLLNNPCEPTSASYMRWEAFYEDQSPAMQTGFGDHYSSHEMIVDLIKRQPTGWQDLAITTLDTISARYLIEDPSSRYSPYTPITLEWSGWPEGTYASSLQYARTALLLHQSLAGDDRQDDQWRQTALDMAAACSHGQNTRKVDGRMFTTIRDMVAHFNVDSWYEQDFNTVIYFLEIMALEPNLAPATGMYILDADAALTSIDFPLDGAWMEYATAGGAGTEQIKLNGKPGDIFAGGYDAGDHLPELNELPNGTPGWYWDAATYVATVYHEASPVGITSAISGVPGDDPRAVGQTSLKLRAVGTGRAAIGVDLARDGNLKLAVYDLRGRLVRDLMTDEWLTAGTHQVLWDGRDSQGQMAASGVYLVRGSSGQAVAQTRIVQVR